MSEFIASSTLMYLASRNQALPDEAISRVMPIAKREVDALVRMFPSAPIEEVQKFARSCNVSRNYGRAGFEIRFAAGYDFDIDSFIDSFSDDEDVVVEAHILKFEKNNTSDKGQSVYRSGKATVEDPENFGWKMLSQFRMERLLKESDESKKRYLHGQRVVATGRFEKYSDARVSQEIKTLGAIVQDRIDDQTTLVLVGHDPDRAIVDQALTRNLQSSSI